MTIYVALLRGINVGGKNIIKMVDLKQIFENIGLHEVKTYIQSGNVIFKSSEEEEPLRKKIEYEIKRAFGFSVSVILRNSKELDMILQNCPFSEEKISEAKSFSKAESLYVALLRYSPSEENIQIFSNSKNECDEYIIHGRDIFLLFHNSIRNSKFASALQKLGVPVTTRNWKTIEKINTLVKELES